MLSEIKGTLLHRLPWGEFSFDDVLAYHNGPRLLLQRSPAGQLYLAWWSDEDDSVERWICLPLSEARLRAILSGEMASRDALEQPEDGYLLAADLDLATDAAVRIVKTTATALPQDAMPMPGSHLNVPAPALALLGLVEDVNDKPTFKVSIGVGHPDGGDFFPVRPAVNTEMPHSMLPASLLADLNVPALEELGFILADGSRVRYDFGMARFRIDEKERQCPVIFGPDGNYLLGATALETFNLLADPHGERLVPAEWLRLGWGGEI